MSKLQVIKNLNCGLSYDKYKYIEDEQIDWLIQQTEDYQELIESIIRVNDDPNSDFHPAISVWARKAKENLKDK